MFNAALYNDLSQDPVWVSEEEFATREEAAEFAQTHAEEEEIAGAIPASIKS